MRISKKISIRSEKGKKSIIIIIIIMIINKNK
jgi:hypothetical protein